MNSTEWFEELQRSDAQPKPIPLAYVVEAINQREMYVENTHDAVYLLACLNLLNRYVKEDRTERHFTKRDLYLFKRRVSQVLEIVIAHRFEKGEVWIAGDVTYACLFGLQFSFHNLPKRPALAAFSATPQNRTREWSGFRLQPRACLVLDWARQLRTEFYATGRNVVAGSAIRVDS